jgi:hypothetical protein
MLKRRRMFLALFLVLTLMLPFTLSGNVFAAGAVTTTITGPVNGCYVNANGTATINRPTSIAGNAELDGKYVINGVVKDSKLITQSITGTATAGTTSVKVMVKNLSTGRSLDISKAAFVAGDVYNTASGTTSWSLPAATISTVDFANGNYVIKAIANDGADGVPSTGSFTVLNAQIVAPAFDEEVKGVYTVKAKIIDTGDASDVVIGSVTADIVDPSTGASAASIPLALNSQTGNYEGVVSSATVADGVYTMVVTAKGRNYVGKVFSDFILCNQPLGNTTTAKVNPGNKREFMLDGKPFRYVGGNNYGFTMKPTEVKSADSTAVIWTGDQANILFVPKGATWRFEEKVDRVFMEMAKSGFNVMRIWFFSQGTENPATTIKRDGTGGDANYRVRYFFDTNGDGKPETTYNDVTLSRMDYILYSAAKHGVMIMPTLANYWNDYGGIQTTMNYIKKAFPEDPYANLPTINTSNYSDTTATNAPQNAFFKSENAWNSYKELIDTFVNRISTVDGKPWKGNPAIFAWDLMNEPRYGLDQDNSRDGLFWEGDGPDAYTEGQLPLNLKPADPRAASYLDNGGKVITDVRQSTLYKWIDKASTYLKSVDPNHMVNAGTEGQTMMPDPLSASGKPWAGYTSQGFGGDPLGTTAAPNIDFLSIHPYIMQNWAQNGASPPPAGTPNNGYYTPAEGVAILKALCNRAKELNMPLIDGELGVGKGNGGTNENGNRITSPTNAAVAANYNWYWNVQLKTVLENGVAGINVWQLTLQGHNDGLGYYVYHNGNAATVISSKMYWDLFKEAKEQIYNWN